MSADRNPLEEKVDVGYQSSLLSCITWLISNVYSLPAQQYPDGDEHHVLQRCEMDSIETAAAAAAGLCVYMSL